MRHEVTAPMRLIEALEAMHPEASRTSLRRMLTLGRVTIDGEPAHKANLELAAGRVVEVGPRPAKPEGFDDPRPDGRTSMRPKRLRVLHEDADLIVVDKPAGLLSVATDKGGSHHLLEAVRRHRRQMREPVEVEVVHRLDRETSGVMVFAKDGRTCRLLQEQFAERTVERVYHAIVLGNPESTQGSDHGTVRNLLRETKALHVVPTADPREGKESITHWEVEAAGPRHAQVRLVIDTGRRAQIRVHMSGLGHPLAGDTMYGPGKTAVGRLCLHASSLSFDHPADGRRVEVVSPLPGLFVRLLHSKT